MASVDWQKQTRQKAGAMRRHLGKQEREKVNHSNPDIDRSKSHLNYYIGCDDYEEAYRRMCERVREVDKLYPPKRVRKDRTVCVSLEFPCPLVITEQGRSREFFEASHELFKEFFGTENVNGLCVHLDEVHKYIDSKDGQEKTSLEHATELVAAYAEWSEKDNTTGEKIERRGINGKHFETRQRLSALNKAMCEMVREKFGVDYNTGEGARKKTAELLKAETELAAIEAAKQKEESKLAELKQGNKDFVSSLTPSSTKKVKTIFGEKDVAKTNEELQRDKEILAAQAAIKHAEEREHFLNERDKKSLTREKNLNNFQAELDKKSKALDNDRRALETEKKALEAENKSFAQAAAIKARQLVDKVLRSLGVSLNRGYDIDSQISLAVRRERGEQQWERR